MYDPYVYTDTSTSSDELHSERPDSNFLHHPPPNHQHDQHRDHHSNCFCIVPSFMVPWELELKNILHILLGKKNHSKCQRLHSFLGRNNNR